MNVEVRFSSASTLDNRKLTTGITRLVRMVGTLHRIFRMLFRLMKSAHLLRTKPTSTKDGFNTRLVETTARLEWRLRKIHLRSRY